MHSQQFIERVYPFKDFIFRTFICLGLSKESARDYTQDILVKVWSKRGELEAVQNLKAYLAKIIRNKVMDNTRHEAVFRNKLVPVLRVQESFCESSVEERDLLSHVFVIMDRLPEKSRLIFMLRSIDGFSYEELGDIFSMSLENVRMSISRSRKFIREEFKKIDYDS